MSVCKSVTSLTAVLESRDGENHALPLGRSSLTIYPPQSNPHPSDGIDPIEPTALHRPTIMIVAKGPQQEFGMRAQLTEGDVSWMSMFVLLDGKSFCIRGQTKASRSLSSLGNRRVDTGH